MQVFRAALAAVAFLTRLPVGRLGTFGGSDIARGAILFPLVGVGIGAAYGGVADGLVHVVPATVAGGLALVVAAILTGAMHLDGLADTADGLTAPRERALEIMRDHATGAYGTAALVLDLIVKTTALGALAAAGHVVTAALAAGALSRAVPVGLSAVLPGVRAQGSGAFLAGRVSRTTGAGALVLAAVVAIAACRLDGLWLAATALVVAVVLGSCFRR